MTCELRKEDVPIRVSKRSYLFFGASDTATGGSEMEVTTRKRREEGAVILSSKVHSGSKGKFVPGGACATA